MEDKELSAITSFLEAFTPLTESERLSVLKYCLPRIGLSNEPLDTLTLQIKELVEQRNREFKEYGPLFHDFIRLHRTVEKARQDICDQLELATSTDKTS